MVYIYVIIAVLVYTASFYGSWKYIEIAHSNGGIFEHLEIGKYDFLVILAPLVNTVMCLWWLKGKPINKEEYK